jgi:hypothetical protein
MNQVGTWSLAGKPLHGLPLTLLWSAESLALITLTLRITEWKSPKSTK